jgi:hypothetical protein
MRARIWLEAHLFDCLVQVLMVLRLWVWLWLYSRGKEGETQRGGWPALAEVASGPSFTWLRLLKKDSIVDSLCGKDYKLVALVVGSDVI